MPSSMAQSHLSLNLPIVHLSPPCRSRPRAILPQRSSKFFSSRLVRAMSESGDSTAEPTKSSVKETTASSSLPTPGGPVLPLPNISTWAKWGLASLALLIIPFYKRFFQIEDKVEKTAEQVVEAVEDVVKVVEKVAINVAEALPENGNLRKEVIELEEIAEEVGKDAQQADNFIHKIDEITDEIEKSVEPIAEAGKKQEKEKENEKLK